MTREEAIDIIRKNIPHLGIGAAEMTDALEELIPELRESEDERIRKKLYHTVLGTPNNSTWFDGTSKEAMLAWLEKQKESHIPWYDYQKSKEAGYTIVPNGEYEQLIKQKEQNPAEKQDYSGLNDLERAILRGFLCAGIENVPVGIIKDTASECMGFLAIIEPKPAEWSEEDEKNLGQVISGRYLPLGLREWFCGLPERFPSRSSWKPSEEQMRCLCEAIRKYNSSVGEYPQARILESLYKKLQNL